MTTNLRSNVFLGNGSKVYTSKNGLISATHHEFYGLLLGFNEVMGFHGIWVELTGIFMGCCCCWRNLRTGQLGPDPATKLHRKGAAPSKGSFKQKNSETKGTSSASPAWALVKSMRSARIKMPKISNDIHVFFPIKAMDDNCMWRDSVRTVGRALDLHNQPCSMYGSKCSTQIINDLEKRFFA